MSHKINHSPSDEFFEKVGFASKGLVNKTKNLINKARNTWRANNESIRKGPDKPTKKILLGFDRAIDSFNTGYESYKKGGRIMGNYSFKNQKD